MGTPSLRPRNTNGRIASQGGDSHRIHFSLGEEQHPRGVEHRMCVVQRDFLAGFAQVLRAVRFLAVVVCEAAVANLHNARRRGVGDRHAPPIAALVLVVGLHISQAEPLNSCRAQPSAVQIGKELVPVQVVPLLARLPRELLRG